MAATDEAVDWAGGLDALVEQIARRFRRIEPRRRVRAYLQGCWLRWSARTAGNWPRMPGIVRPTGCRTFSPACAGMPIRCAMTPACARLRLCRRAIGRCRCGAGPGRDRVCQEREQVGRGAAAVFGHGRRIENCQIGVFLGYASRHGHALIDRALYLPEVWANDPAPAGRGRVPADTAFATKPQLGRQMLISAFAAGVPCRWVTGDSVYGADYALRRCIEKGGRGYVLAVTSRQRLGFKTVADWLEDVPGHGLAAAECGRGRQGAAAV